MRLIAVGGTSQRGFPGELLGDPIAVQVVDSALKPIPGVHRIRFTAVAGGGSVSDTTLLTAVNGTALVMWRLGPIVGLQQVTATIAEDGSAAGASIFANSISRDDADLVVVHGATPQGSVGILMRQDNFTWQYTLVWPDTILRLLPHEPVNEGPAGTASWQEVTAFSVGHPPVTALQPWTTGRDTVAFVLRAPVAVPFTIWLTYDVDTTAARARHDLAALDLVWRSHMTGLQVGHVQFASAPNLHFECGGDNRGYFDATSINVYYMNYLTPPEACDAHIIRMNANNAGSFSDVYQFLLAHEVGHTLSLDHVSDPANVMWPQSPVGSRLTTGQIYWMHFHSWGALNTALGIHPIGERNCSLPFSTHCPAQMFIA